MSLFDQPLGQLARDIPGITAVFHKHRLDFCCGGAQTLREAATRRNLDLNALQAELDALPRSESGGENWAGVTEVRLIDHILTRYHAIHRQQLPELARLAQRVEQVHGERSNCPVGLADHLAQLYTVLDIHMQKEEQVLFPLIAAGQSDLAFQPVAMMRREHDEHAEALARIDELTNDITPPSDACNTWRALYAGLAAFKVDLMNHIHLENNVLFDRIDRQLEGVRHG